VLFNDLRVAFDEIVLGLVKLFLLIVFIIDIAEVQVFLRRIDLSS
jgi:hypothetical protein